MRNLYAVTTATALAFTCGPAVADDCPVYPDEAKAIVYQEMNARTLVRDSYIGQDGCRLSLVLVVGHAATEAFAKDQADDMVGAYTPDETRVALGAKNRQARRISW